MTQTCHCPLSGFVISLNSGSNTFGVSSFSDSYFRCDENVNLTLKSTSSEDDDESSSSPTNNMNTAATARKFLDKPTLVKRLALGLLRSTDEYRPLVGSNKSSPPSPTKSIFDHQDNAINDLHRIISNRFGDSCRQSLQSVRSDTQDLDKRRKKLIRETNSATCSPKRIFSPLKRTDSLNQVEENDLKSAAWYQEGLPREISLEVLAQQPPGAFLVRRSNSKTGCFALTVRIPPPGPKVAHYLILKTSRGYKIKGFTKEFSTLRALITHHSVMPEMLPVPLSLPRPKNLLMKSRKADDYNSYNDLKKIIAELNLNNGCS